MKSIGTKAIVDELSRSFPEARIQRFDTDNKKAERLEAHYQAVSAGEVDIIVGTQIVAKGLDLPRLSTVGVVIADTSLYLPDYTAQERSYQLLRQVIGRVGRGHRDSSVIVQTYDPRSKLIQDAVSGSWNDFYAHELQERKKFLFPPFCYTLKLTCRRATPKGAEQAGRKLSNELQKSGLRILIDGPMPAYHEKVGGRYQYQLVLKSKNRQELLRAIALLPSNWSYDIDPLNLL
jgi:primosomal protein N' (replication factor Y)